VLQACYRRREKDIASAGRGAFEHGWAKDFAHGIKMKF
jgi:hypothetical protein